MKSCIKTKLNCLFSQVNYSVFLALYVSLCLYEFIGLKWIWSYDSGSNPKYILVCNLGLLLYAFWTGFLVKQRHFLYFLPSLLIPVCLMVMEWINFKSLLRFDFYSQLAIYMLFGMAWNALCYLILSSTRINAGIKKIFSIFQTSLETVLLFLIFSISINACLNGGINNDAVVAMCQTNLKEAWHYFWGINHGLLLCFLIFPLLLVLAYGMMKLRHNRLPNPNHTFENAILKLGMVGSVLLFCGLCILANFFIYFIPLTWRTLQAYNDYFLQIEHYQELLKKRNELTAQFLKQYETREIQGKDGIFVLVIGESLDRRYKGCYDSKRRTTPFQDKLRQSSDSVFWERAYACHVQTTRVLPMMLTFYNQYLVTQDYSEAELSLSLIDIARCNGYKAYWFSNQEKMSNANSIISSLAASGDVAVFTRELTNGDCFDEAIVHELEKQTFDKRSLVIIHLTGNHYPYGMTYPKDFDFPPELDTYEKSVYYNDWVLQQISEFFSKQPLSLIAYVSDHADAVSVGKGHDPRPEKFLKEMVEIPLWLHFSPDYRKRCPDLFDKVQKSSSKCITNDLVYNLFQNLMGLDNSFSPEQFSPLSPDYILDEQSPLTLDRQMAIPAP